MPGRDPAIRSLLEVLLADLAGGAARAAPAPAAAGHFATGPWRGLTDVVLRYDCVAFHLEDRRTLEVRTSRLPDASADLVRRIWLEVDPAFAEAEAAWARVGGRPPSS